MQKKAVTAKIKRFTIVVYNVCYSDDRHAPPTKKSKDEEEEEDLNDANYDEVTEM